MTNNWYVITGGPSTGKTTLLAELDKLGHRVVPEAARMVIDEGIAKGLTISQVRADELAFQRDVLKLKQKVEAALDVNKLTFLDRGMHDSLAYLRHYGFEIDDWVQELFKNSMYKKVFLLEPLPQYVKDYARTEGGGFTKKMHKLLHDAYADFGMEPIHIPPVSVEERLKIILAHVKQEQPA